MQQLLWSMMASTHSGTSIIPAIKDEERDVKASTLAANAVEEAGAITTQAIINRIAKINEY